MTEQRDRQRERLVRAAVAENQFTAEMIRQTLAQAGIRSMLKNRDGASVTFGGSQSAWSMEVWVLEGDAEAAAALLGGDPPAPALPPPALPDQPGRPTGGFRRWFRKRSPHRGDRQ